MISLNLTAQDRELVQDTLYNRWSIELAVGQNKPIRPFAEGYYSSQPNNYLYINGVQHYNVGVRYMFNTYFGLKLDAAYDQFKNRSESGSLPFELTQYRIGLQGVANLRALLRLDNFSRCLGLLVHGGITYSQQRPEFGMNKGRSEDNGGIIFGITPQVKLSKRLVITGDFSVLNNVRQHFNWDGSYASASSNLSGVLYNTSLGIHYYLGKRGQEHADWFVEPTKTVAIDTEARKRLDAIETQMNDTDKDGVPDFLDRENNTPAGVAVDSRGRYIDLNKNGVPDELERKGRDNRIDQNFIENNNGISNTEDKKFNSTQEVLAELIEKGHVNIYFDKNKDTPNAGSTNNVMLIYQYLKSNPQVSIKLTGFADESGDEKFNQDLSERRALKLKNFLVASGIPSERVLIVGQGVDPTFPNSITGLDLARRVSIEVFKN